MSEMTNDDNLEGNAEIQRVLDFWFADTGSHAPTAADNKRWFGGGIALDREIEQRFGHLLEQDLQSWRQSAHGILAYVILHDQFPLNIYRRQAKAYAFEQRAELATLEAIELGFDSGLGYGERVFLYMPLMHSERLELQDLGVEKYQLLVADADESLREAAAGNLKYAREHRDTVVKFGRFPFRNQVLGRQSTTEEEAYLNSGAPRYGQ